MKERVFDIDFLIGNQKCEVCNKDITRSTVVLCSTCGIILCLPCLYKGTEVGEHRRSDSYMILDSLKQSIYSPDWTAREELMLMKGRFGSNGIIGIEKFGVDNWSEIADYIDSKTAEECEKHYYSFYYKSANHKSLSSKQSKNGKTISGRGEVERGSTNKKGEVKEEHVGEISGYMPLRGEFTVEHENDAELLLADMEFFDNDPDTELKYKILDMYNNILDQRSIRKQFVQENDLLNLKKREAEAKKSKEEREVLLQMRPFQNYFEPSQFNELVEGLIEEKKLQKELNKLQGSSKSSNTSSERSKKQNMNAEKQKGKGKEVILSNREQELCIILNLQSHVYADVKSKLISKGNKINKETAKKLANSEVSKEQVLAIYEYLAYYDELTSKVK